MSLKSKVQSPKSAERANLLAKPAALKGREMTASSYLSLWERLWVRGMELELAQKTSQSNDLLQPFLSPKVHGQSQLASVTNFGLELNAC